MTYDAADNGAKSYTAAIHALRMEGLRSGKFTPNDLAEELVASGKAQDYRRIGPHVLYNGDCAGILPLLGKVDALVCDPPYGIGFVNNAKHVGGGWKVRADCEWDAIRPSDDLMALALASAHHAIVWGGNYFTDMLPPTGKWLSWDKGQYDFSLADFELAWCSFGGAARRILLPRGVAIQDGKTHPTQKPVEVMRWCIEKLPTPNTTILDPFMGSGTTGVACQKLGRHFIGIERDPNYFAISCRRIEQAMQQPDLFIETPKRAEQIGMDLTA